MSNLHAQYAVKITNACKDAILRERQRADAAVVANVAVPPEPIEPNSEQAAPAGGASEDGGQMDFDHDIPGDEYSCYSFAFAMLRTFLSCWCYALVLCPRRCLKIVSVSKSSSPFEEMFKGGYFDCVTWKVLCCFRGNIFLTIFWEVLECGRLLILFV